MAILKVYNKKRDITYVYDSYSYWDKEKQQPRSKRKLIGKVDPVTGEIVPTGKHGGRKRKTEETYREMYKKCSAELKICKARLDGKEEVIADFQRRITEAEQEIKKLRSAIKKAQKSLTQTGEK